jgi:hypothetical protein
MYYYIYERALGIEVITMTREQFLKEKILEIDTIKGFAARIDMPYTTLYSILNNVGGASIDNVLKICKGLNIPAVILEEFDSQNTFSYDEELISLQRNYKGLGKAERQQLNDFIDFLKSKHDSNMPEDDDLD